VTPVAPSVIAVAPILAMVMLPAAVVTFVPVELLWWRRRHIA
jgi:hypothetical protein